MPSPWMRPWIAIMLVGWGTTLAGIYLTGPIQWVGWLGTVPALWAMVHISNESERRAWIHDHERLVYTIREMGRWMKVTLRCACGDTHEVDADRADEDTREARLNEAAEWSAAHSGKGHGVGFNLPGVAQGGPQPPSEGTQS